MNQKLSVAMLLVAFSCQISMGQSVINVPPEAAPNSIEDTTLNLRDGGTLPYGFQALRGSTLNIEGGTAEGLLRPQDGSMVNISGGAIGVTGPGTVGRSLLPQSGSTLFISGGAIGNSFYAESGVSITFEGLDFRLNGELIEGLGQPGNSKTVPTNLRQAGPDFTSFTGILSDGTPFTYVEFDDDFFSNMVTLVRSADLGDYPVMVEYDDSGNIHGALPGQTVRAGNGVLLPDRFGAAHGSRIEVLGGGIGANFEADGAEIEVMNGTVGVDFSAINESSVNITDSVVASRFVIANKTRLVAVESELDTIELLMNSVLTVEGGKLSSAQLRGNSTLHLNRTEVTGGVSVDNSSIFIDSGTLRGQFNAGDSSLVEIHGGSFDEVFWSITDRSEIKFVGEEFLLNGSPILEFGPDGSTLVPINDGDLLSGVLADGSPFETRIFQRTSRPVLPGLYFRTDSTLRLVQAIPEPNSLALLGMSCLLFATGSRARKLY